jgi:hypothetical protein
MYAKAPVKPMPKPMAKPMAKPMTVVPMNTAPVKPMKDGGKTTVMVSTKKNSSCADW